MKIIFLLLITITQIRCATDEAARLRTERPLSIGLLGAAIRPSDSVTLGADFSVFSDDGGGETVAFNLKEDRDVTQRGNSIDIFGLWHPWETSAFYLGLGFRRGSGTVSFDADKVGTGETKVKYERTHTYATLPVGWYWIWGSGFTLALDLGPNIRLSQQNSYKDDGGDDVDTNDRDDFRDDLQDSGKITFGGRGLIGWSF